MRFLYVALLLAVTASPAFAQREPQIVIPGKRGVPVIINGIDASWGVVIGEFGLDRPGEMSPVVIYQPLLASVPYIVPGYYPKTGKKPGYGRLEIVPPPNQPPPPPAPTYFRSWSSQSAPGPVTDYAPYPMPSVVVEPNFGRRNHGHYVPGPMPWKGTDQPAP
jgi:hypothetical protein